MSVLALQSTSSAESEVQNDVIYRALKAVGVRFPFGGYGPGTSTCRCTGCRRIHLADPTSMTCLPCALKGQMSSGLHAREKAFEAGRAVGRVEFVAEVTALAQRQTRGTGASV